MKVISVPVDSNAMNRLDMGENVTEDLLELPLSDELYLKLESIGFFAHINQLTGTNIDNFEDDSITAPTLLKRVIESSFVEELMYDASMMPIIKQIKEIFIEAINRNTGVFFYF